MELFLIWVSSDIIDGRKLCNLQENDTKFCWLNFTMKYKKSAVNCMAEKLSQNFF